MQRYRRQLCADMRNAVVFLVDVGRRHPLHSCLAACQSWVNVYALCQSIIAEGF